MKKTEDKKPDPEQCFEADDYLGSAAGVLLSHEIKYYAEKHQMIFPFDPDKLKPAGYRLTLGEEYAMGGRRGRLSSEAGKDELTIQPFDVAIVSTGEIINLPRFIIARWNLRVSLVYEGLLWTGALQVDPGWYGPLYCPIYNLSDEDVVLRLGDPICLMDFVKTTPYKPGESKPYPRPPERKTLEDYHYRLKSALVTKHAAQIKDMREKVDRVYTLLGLVFTMVVVLFAALSILVTSLKAESKLIVPKYFLVWIILSIGLSITAIIIRRRPDKRIKITTDNIIRKLPDIKISINTDSIRGWRKFLLLVVAFFVAAGLVNLIASAIRIVYPWIERAIDSVAHWFCSF